MTVSKFVVLSFESASNVTKLLNHNGKWSSFALVVAVKGSLKVTFVSLLQLVLLLDDRILEEHTKVGCCKVV